MLLNKPSFPISFTLEDTVAFIEDLIKSRGWTDFEVADIKLLYTPYWVFNYSAFQETVREETKSKIVSDINEGRLAMNAVTGEFNEEVPELLNTYTLERIRKPEEGYQFEIIQPIIEEDKVKSLAPLKLAQKMQLGKENVVISGLTLAFVPIWTVNVFVAEGVFRLEINAVTGESSGEEEVPEREKGWLEVTQQTLEELKEPGAWLRYSGEIIGSTSGALTSSTGNLLHAFWTNRKLQTLILLAILAIILLDFYGFI